MAAWTRGYHGRRFRPFNGGNPGLVGMRQVVAIACHAILPPAFVTWEERGEDAGTVTPSGDTGFGGG